MKTSIRLLRVTIGVFLVLGGDLTSGEISSADAKSQLVRLTLNWKPEPEFGGFYEAQSQGMFQKKDLEVDIRPGGSGTPVIQMVAAGQTEFGIASGEEIILSNARGAPVTALFAVYQTSPVAIMSHESQGFHSIGDVFKAPGVLAVSKGLPFYAFLEKKLGKPKALVVPYLGGILNFTQNKAYSQQSFMTSEPLQVAKKGIAARSFLVSDEGFSPYMTVLVTRKEYLDKNPAVVKAMVEAVREGWKTYLKDPVKTNSVMQKLNTSIDSGSFAEISETQKKFIETQDTIKNGIGTMTLERWKTLAEQFKSIGLIQDIPNISEVYKNL